MRALMVSIGPFIYASAYRFGAKLGFPGAPFIAAAAVCCLAEYMHRRLKVNVTWGRSCLGSRL